MRYSIATLFLFAALSSSTPSHAQATPTEREAARDRLKTTAALEQALDRARELMDKELLPLADDIATHPEIGFEEKRSVGKLVEYLQKHDFSVETGSAGLTTAVVARYRKNNGGPTLGVIVEYDALRGTNGAFHGDQHSAQGPVGLV